MILYLKFGDPEDAMAFKTWVAEEGLDTPEDMGDYEGFGPKNVILIVRSDDPRYAVWEPFVVSAGIS